MVFSLRQVNLDISPPFISMCLAKRATSVAVVVEPPNTNAFFVSESPTDSGPTVNEPSACSATMEPPPKPIV